MRVAMRVAMRVVMRVVIGVEMLVSIDEWLHTLFVSRSSIERSTEILGVTS